MTKLPPGPRGKLRCTARMVRDPLGSLRDWQDRYGHTFCVDFITGPAIFTADPELIREIYSVRDLDLFHAVSPETTDVLVGRGSVMLMSGQQHQRERKLLTPPFHGDRMRSWARVMAEAGRHAFAAFAGKGELRALERTQAATLEVIVRVVFGVDEPARLAEFVRAIGEWTATLHPSFLFMRLLQREWFGLSRFARYRRASDRLDALLREQIARVRAATDQRDDILTSLVAARYDDGGAMADAAIIDELRTLLIAGHETTAVTLAWALYFVHREPDLRARLLAELAELDEPEQLARAPLLGAVIDETMRIRPVVAQTFRRLRKPWRFGEWILPAEATVSPAVPLVHHRADLWPEPDRFRPERFLPSRSPTTEKSDRPGPFVYLPFGGGAHRCLGATFARFELSVMLGTLLRELELELLEREIEWGLGRTTLEPLGGVRMQVLGSR